MVVLLPVAAILSHAFDQGIGPFWSAVSDPEAAAAIELSLACAAIVAVLDAAFGTLIAWVLVRDDFRGKRIVNILIDLPFALPTIVAGLTLVALYGHGSPVGIDITFTRGAIVFALAFVTLPFVVRSVQPVLMELDPAAEEAAASLGAGPVQTFFRVVLPALRGAIFSGTALSFARALGEFGSLTLIGANLPFKTEAASIYIFSQLGQGDAAGEQSAAAVSVALLVLALVVVALFSLVTRWANRHATR